MKFDSKLKPIIEAMKGKYIIRKPNGNGDFICINNEEKALIKLLGKKWKWICKDRVGSVFVYEIKPKKGKLLWHTNGHTDVDVKYLNDINNNLNFDFLSWNDAEPTSLDELRELIKGDING